MQQQAPPTGRAIRLLDVDPDLGQDLEDGPPLDRARAELICRSARLDWTRCEGHWGPRDVRGHLGLLIVEGLMLREVVVARGGSAELLGGGDLLRPWDVDGEEFLPIRSRVEWTALTEVTVALLDRDFAARVCRWPPVVARLITRNSIRAKANTLNQAISHFKHVESRLLLVFWHFAERWGRVRADDVTIELPLTHELLGKLVGATRPSVTTALGQLARRGLLHRDGTVWHLSRDSADRLDTATVPIHAGDASA